MGAAGLQGSPDPKLGFVNSSLVLRTLLASTSTFLISKIEKRNESRSDVISKLQVPSSNLVFVG
jgi:hypothetical protein